MKKTYVTAFQGRRDSYQVPLALAEHGRLAEFITCFYRDKGMLGWLASTTGLGAGILKSRHAAGIPPERIQCLEIANAATRLGQRILQPSKIAVWEDDHFARAAVAAARRKRAGLFLYEFQADWAFRQPLPGGGARILFQFHPHPDLEHPLLLADGQRYPQFLPGIRRNTRSNLAARYRDHTRQSWRNADHVIVASSFTARSLQVAGCPAEKITVVPYGCSFGSEAPTAPPTGQRKPYFLFVGSGTHRKGLHHLLEAWAGSRVQTTHELVVIARVIDPELLAQLTAVPGVRLLRGAADLSGWYAGARAFVLPSMSEGFGHVYLEALASGCPIIGTRHSMLPDFAEAKPHIRYVEPGDPAGLRAQLELVAGLPAQDVFFQAAAIRGSVKQYTWQRFRDGIEAVLGKFD